MNNKQKTRKSFMNFMNESKTNENAARKALFRKTFIGTKFMNREQVATLLVKHNVSYNEIKSAI